MNERQRTMLLDVISEWAGIVNDAYATPRMAEIKADLDDTWFAWSGATTHEPGKNGSAYYRIQGPKLVIEFSPQGGGDPTMHVHTMYRDPTNDYGIKFYGCPMRKLLAVVAAILFSFQAFAEAQQAPTTADIVLATNAFLSSLTTDQRQKVL